MISRSAWSGSTVTVLELFQVFGSTVVDVAVAVFGMTETGPTPEAGGSTFAVIVSVSELKAGNLLGVAGGGSGGNGTHIPVLLS